jgi:hypothetical protein
MCCGQKTMPSNIRIISGTRSVRRPVELNDFAKLADPEPVIVGDDLLFRWSHIIKLAKLIPGMSAVRALEHQIQKYGCRSCQKQTVTFDRAPLETVRRYIATCSLDTLKLVKEAAGIIKFKISYRDLAGVPHEVVR